jgi:predicted nucleic acid-binding protein
MSRSQVVVLDANVLYPRLLRSLFMELSLADLIRARWTDSIHDEWIRSVLKDYPDIPPEYLAETRRLMNLHAEASLIVEYEHLIGDLRLPDLDDRHVLAAAIEGNADIIVTFNVQDFPLEELSRYDIEAQHPDRFLSNLLELYRQDFLTVIAEELRKLKNPPLTSSELLIRLENLGLPLTVSKLKFVLDE